MGILFKALKPIIEALKPVFLDLVDKLLPIFFKNSYFAGNGLEGISQAIENKIDILITDLSMPKMNGIDMIVEIKKFNPKIKVVCASGHNENDFIEKAEKLGCSFIIKPISSSELFRAIDEVL